MTGRSRPVLQNMSCLRSQSSHDSRDRVTRATSELHRQTVDRAQRRFEQQLADSEHQVRWAVRQRRDYSSSPAEKRQATQHLQQLHSELNNDYTQLVQEKVNEVGRYINPRYDNGHQIDQRISPRRFHESLQEPQFQNEKPRLITIQQITRERDGIYEDKKNLYNRHRDEQTYYPNRSSIPIEHLDIAQLKGRLARVEYEHRELKELLFNLRTDLVDLVTQPPRYKSTVHIPNFC